MRSPAAAALCALSVTLTGCCSISRAFCGPDTSAWISVDLSTPELAARTLLEALRRDEPEVVYDALSDELREELGVGVAADDDDLVVRRARSELGRGADDDVGLCAASHGARVLRRS